MCFIYAYGDMHNMMSHAIKYAAPDVITCIQSEMREAIFIYWQLYSIYIYLNNIYHS